MSIMVIARVRSIDRAPPGNRELPRNRRLDQAVDIGLGDLRGVDPQWRRNVAERGAHCVRRSGVGADDLVERWRDAAQEQRRSRDTAVPPRLGPRRHGGRGADDRRLPAPGLGNRRAGHFDREQRALGKFRRGLDQGLDAAAERDQRPARPRLADEARGVVFSGGEQRLVPHRPDDAQFGELALFDQSCAHFAGAGVPQQPAGHVIANPAARSSARVSKSGSPTTPEWLPEIHVISPSAWPWIA